MNASYTLNLFGALALAMADRTAQALEHSLGASGNVIPALLSIGTRPGQSVDKLAHVLGVSHSTTVRIVDRLEDAGWARRTRATEDGRSVLLQLTPAGRRAFRELLGVRRRAIAEITKSLTEREVDVLQDLLRKMLASLPRTRRDAQHICRLCDHAVCHDQRCPVGHAVTNTTSAPRPRVKTR